MFEPITLKLEHPITMGSNTICELVFDRMPKAKDLLSVKLTDLSLGDIFKVAAKLCNQPPSALGELEGGDIMAVSSLVMGFLTGGPATGG